MSPSEALKSSIGKILEAKPALSIDQKMYSKLNLGENIMGSYRTYIGCCLSGIVLTWNAFGLQVGMSTRDITPSTKLTMGGYGVYVGLGSGVTRTNGEGVHDPIQVQCIALAKVTSNKLVLCSLDLVGLSGSFVDGVREQLADATDSSSVQLVLSSSHNHQGPDTFGLWGALPFRSGKDANYMKFLKNEIIETVKEAIAKMEAAFIRYGTSSLENRIVGKFQDSNLMVMSFHSAPSGKRIGTLCQWSAHPTILGHHNNTISADFIGSYRKLMQKEYLGEHMYFNGTLGGVYASDIGESEDLFPEGDQDPHMEVDYRRTANLGHKLFDRVKDSLNGLTDLDVEEISFKSARVSIPLKNLLFSVAIRNRLIDVNLVDGKAVTEVSWIHLGRVQAVFFPGEVFPSLAVAARNMLKKAGASDTMVIGMANDWLGYLMTSEEYSSSEFSYQAMLSPGRAAGKLVLEGLGEMILPSIHNPELNRALYPGGFLALPVDQYLKDSYLLLDYSGLFPYGPG